MRSEESNKFRRVLEEWESAGLLLVSDAKLPSVASLVAGEPVRGSWWAHPRGHAIFQMTCKLAGHPDALAVKLVSGKVTFAHRNFWPALFAVATSGEPWQTQGLSSAARSLLARVRREGRLRTDQVQKARGAGSKAVGEAARELEAKLLVSSEQVHTESGSHAKCLESWDHWAGRMGFGVKKMAVEEAKKQLEEAVRALNARFGANGQLPWRIFPTSTKSRRRLREP